MSDDLLEYRAAMSEVEKRKRHPDYEEIARDVLRDLRESNAPLDIFQLHDEDPQVFLAAYDEKAQSREREKLKDPSYLRRQLARKETQPRPRPASRQPTETQSDRLLRQIREAPDEDSNLEAVARYLEHIDRQGGENE